MEIKWEDGFHIRVSAEEGRAAIAADAAGLRSLAGILLVLAGGAPGEHVHLDAYNSLEDGSAELILERAEDFGEARA